MPEFAPPDLEEITVVELPGTGSTIGESFTNFSFTPVSDGQAFTSAPFTSIFNDLQFKLNRIDRDVVSVGALNHEHLSASFIGETTTGSRGYILHSGSTSYYDNDSLPPGVWLHSASDPGNVLTSFAAGELNHWSCGAEGPVGKPTRPTFLRGLSVAANAELVDSSTRDYIGGIVILFDGVLRLIGNYHNQQAPDNPGHGAFYIVLYASVSINGGDYKDYPIPVTERYIDCVPKSPKLGYPATRDGQNFSFRHLFTSRSIPLSHEYPGDTKPDIKSMKVRSFRVGVSLNANSSEFDQLGFHVSSTEFSYMAISGKRNRLYYVPNSHGNLGTE